MSVAMRIALSAASVLAGAPATAAVFIGTQVVDTRLAGSGDGVPFDVARSDGGNRAGTITAAAQAPQDGGVRGTSSVVASLIGTERGRITFRRALSVDAPGGAVSGIASYLYYFTTDTPTAFELNWGVSAYGGVAPGPAQRASLRSRDDGVLQFYGDPLGDGASGTTSVTIDPGRYELRIEDIAPLGANAVGSATGLSSQFSFAMRTVPEPPTWAMMIAGFAATGAALRRRRRPVFSIR